MIDESPAAGAGRRAPRGRWLAALGVISALAVAVGVTPPEVGAASGPVTRTNYNAPGWSPSTFWRLQAKSPDRLTYVPDPLGQRGLVQSIIVRPGDNNVSGSSAKGERTDVVRAGDKYGDLGGFVDGQTIVMSWSTMIDSNFASPPGPWNNFVNTHTAGGGTQSPWAMNLQGDDAQLRMRLYGGGQWVNGTQAPDSAEERFELGPLAKNQWHDFVLELKYGCTGKGSARVWMDGTQLVEAVDRKIGYCGDPGLYWKQGFYRRAYNKPTQLWFADTLRWKSAIDALAYYGWAGHR